MSYPPSSPGGQDMTRTEPQSDVFQCAETLRHRHVAVMFADLDHFTRICIDDPPEFVFGLIRDFQRVVTSAVAEFRGKLNSYQGDGILATFADLAGRADCTTRALKCAQTILEQIEALSLAHTRMSAGQFRSQSACSTVRPGPALSISQGALVPPSSAMPSTSRPGSSSGRARSTQG
jgi:hypothetical protein